MVDITEPSKQHGTNRQYGLFTLGPSIFGNADEQQIKAILNDENRTGVTAAAGSGKTRTVESAITHLHKRLTNDPTLRSHPELDPQIIALCYTNEAVKNLRTRLAIEHHENAAIVMTEHKLARQIIQDVGSNLSEKRQTYRSEFTIITVTLSQPDRDEHENGETKSWNDELNKKFRAWIDTANKYWKQGYKRLSYRQALQIIAEHEDGTFNPLANQALGLKPEYIWWKYLEWINASRSNLEICLDFGLEIMVATMLISAPTNGQLMEAYRCTQALEIEKNMIEKRYKKDRIGKAIERAIRGIVIAPSDGEIVKGFHDDWATLANKYDARVLERRWWRHIDGLFIDEAQDLNRPQIALIEALRAKRLVAVGDADQNIFAFQGTDRTWLTSMNNQIRLPYNYRCTKNIVSVAEQVIQNGMRTPRSAHEGLPVQEYHALDESDEFAYIANQINAYTQQGFGFLSQDDQGITILARTNDKLDRCKRYLTAHFKDTAVRVDFITFQTIHAAKGQQNGVVFIIGCCEETWAKDTPERDLKNLLYVAMTRAIGFLHITWADKEVFYEAKRDGIESHWQGCHRLHLLEELKGVQIRTGIVTTDEIQEATSKEMDKDLENIREQIALRKEHSLTVSASLERIAQEDAKHGEDKTAKRRHHKAVRISACQTITGYEHLIKTKDDGSTEAWWTQDYRHTDSCKDILCTGCQRAQTNKKRLHLGAGLWYMRNMAAWIQQRGAIKDKRLAMHNAIFLTLTVKNVPIEKLEEARETIKTAWREMTHTTHNTAHFKDKAWKTGFWKNAVMGTWPTFEITFNENEAHPHLHVLMPMRRWYFTDPSTTGIRGKDGKMRRYSNYYLSNRDWAEWWAKSIYAAMGENPTTVISKLQHAWVKDYHLDENDDMVNAPLVTTDLNEASTNGYEDQGGWAIPAPHTKDGFFYIDVRRVYANRGGKGAISEDEAIMEASKYATKGVNFIPLKRDEDGRIIPSISQDEIDKRVKALDDTLYNARLQNPTGILRQIYKKADAGQLINLAATDPLTAPTINTDELYSQYLAREDGPQIVVDKTNTSKWINGEYQTIDEEDIDHDIDDKDEGKIDTKDDSENNHDDKVEVVKTALSDDNRAWLEDTWNAKIDALKTPEDPYNWM